VDNPGTPTTDGEFTHQAVGFYSIPTPYNVNE
jgi:hypothetical protein